MRLFLITSVSVLALSTGAFAQSVDLGAVGVAGAPDTQSDDDTAPPKPGTASAVAPTQSSLSAVEPKTILNSRYIEDVATPVADYLAIVAAAPSSSNSTPNGAGLSSKNAAIRGFQDGQYNVTFDGIPFGDPAAFGHATTAFFPAALLGTVAIDRGPGTASNLGNATFGGTVALYSEDPTSQASGRILGAYGSGNTYQAGTVLNSGTLDQTNGTTGFLNFTHMASDGLLQNAGIRQDNAAVKFSQPVGTDSILTVFSSYDNMEWNTFTQMPVSVTNVYGKSYAGLNNDPNSQAYYKYNLDQRKSDLEYIRLQSDFDGVRVDNKAYTYALDDRAQGGVDQTGATTNKIIKSGVPGADVNSYYRAWGDIVKVEKDIGSGVFATTARTGAWLEHARYDQFAQTVNLQTGQAVTFTGLGYAAAAYNNWNTESETRQTFVEFEWRPLPGLTVIPGFKHVDFGRELSGLYNFVTLPHTSAHYAADLGSTEVNYRILPTLSAYGQWAMGFQAPPASVLETLGASSNHLSPQQTVNYQSGLVWKNDRLTADIDAYYINFTNMIGSNTEPVGPGGANETVYYNVGGVDYKGIETEATYLLGYGFSITGNGSINSAVNKQTKLWIANAPKFTSDAGFLYDQDGVFGSLLMKYVGPRFAAIGQTTDGNPNTHLPAYKYTDLNIGYKIAEGTKIQFSVNNIFDARTITEGSGSKTNPTYYYLPGRNFMGQVNMTF